MLSKILEASYALDSLCALYFTSIIAFYGIISFFTGNDTMPLSLLWQFMILGSLIGVSQYVIYHDDVLPKVSNTIKGIFHFILIGLILVGFIKYFNWVELWSISFQLFLIIYTVYFVSVVVTFYFYKQYLGLSYAGKLNSFQRKLQNGGNEDESN